MSPRRVRWRWTTLEAGATAEDPETGGDNPEGGSSADAPDEGSAAEEARRGRGTAAWIADMAKNILFLVLRLNTILTHCERPKETIARKGTTDNRWMLGNADGRNVISGA
uniref:Uncharacterized protein n=1 Tax=Oryza barthii TaxID=65489 RepID=A0A0D3GTJ9_9ORYZ